MGGFYDVREYLNRRMDKWKDKWKDKWEEVEKERNIDRCKERKM